MTRAAAALLVLLAGCALSPAELRQQGERTTATSKQVPLAAAHCITRNIEAMTFGIGVKLVVHLRPLQGDAFEVIAQDMAIAEVTPAADGSRIVAYRNHNSPLIGSDQLKHMAKGC